MGVANPSQPQNFAISQGKAMIKCTSAGHCTGSRTIYELLQKETRSQMRNPPGQPLTPPKFSEVMPLTPTTSHLPAIVSHLVVD